MNVQFFTDENQTNSQIGIMKNFNLYSWLKYFRDELNGNLKEELLENYNNSFLADEFRKDRMNILKGIPRIAVLKSLTLPTFYILAYNNHFLGSFRLIKKNHITGIKYLGDITEIRLLLVNPLYRRRKVAFNMLSEFLNQNLSKKFMVRIDVKEELNYAINLFLKLNFKISEDYSTNDKLILIKY